MDDRKSPANQVDCTDRDPKQALQLLRAGNKPFMKNRVIDHPYDADILESRGGSQDLYVAILSCADSRVVPEQIFNAGYSDLFVIQIAGNVASEEAIASLQYGVIALKIEAIIVMGHQGCGAVKTAMEGPRLTSYDISRLLSHFQPVLADQEVEVGKKFDDCKLNEVVQANAKHVAEQLRLSSILGSKSIAIRPA